MRRCLHSLILTLALAVAIAASEEQAPPSLIMIEVIEAPLAADGSLIPVRFREVDEEGRLGPEVFSGLILPAVTLQTPVILSVDRSRDGDDLWRIERIHESLSAEDLSLDEPPSIPVRDLAQLAASMLDELRDPELVASALPPVSPAANAPAAPAVVPTSAALEPVWREQVAVVLGRDGDAVLLACPGAPAQGSARLSGAAAAILASDGRFLLLRSAQPLTRGERVSLSLPVAPR